MCMLSKITLDDNTDEKALAQIQGLFSSEIQTRSACTGRSSADNV